MDWLGGGDTIVRDAFIRASDDDLALEGNWDGYTDAEMLRPGKDVQNILVEHSELSTSISNIVRSAGRARLQLAQLHPARLRHSARRHWRMRPDLRPAGHVGR
jgi:hypothetical protein